MGGQAQRGHFAAQSELGIALAKPITWPSSASVGRDLYALSEGKSWELWVAAAL